MYLVPICNNFRLGHERFENRYIWAVGCISHSRFSSNRKLLQTGTIYIMLFSPISIFPGRGNGADFQKGYKSGMKCTTLRPYIPTKILKVLKTTPSMPPRRNDFWREVESTVGLHIFFRNICLKI
jgi:hypothetical protein